MTTQASDQPTPPATSSSGKTPFYLSRTFWVNLVALASLVFPAVQDWLNKNPEQFVAALGAVNVLLRFISYGKYQLADDTKTPSTQSIVEEKKEVPGGASSDCPKNTDVPSGKLTGLIGVVLLCLTMIGCGHEIAVDPGHVVVNRDGQSLVWNEATQTLTWMQTAPAAPPAETPKVIVYKGK